MSVQLLTFKTQQSIIGDVTEDGDFYKVKKPTQVFIQPSQEDPGRTMMGFAPYLEFCEEFLTGMKIPKDQILTVNTPVKDLHNQYNKFFGSGIEVPTKEDIAAIRKAI
jgi:hypothetical protein